MQKIGHLMQLKRSLAVASAVALAFTVPACSSSGGGSGGGFGDCKVTSKKGSISLKPVKSGTLTVETTLPAQGWWNGTTPSSIKSGYEYCIAANLANMAGLKSVTIKNVSFDQLVAGRTNNFDIALAEISITAEREKVVDFSAPYFDSNIGVLTKKGAGVTAGQHQHARSARPTPARRRCPSSRTSCKCKRRKVYPDNQTLYQSVLSGQSDAAFLDTAIVLAEAKATGGKLEVVGQYKTGEKYGAIYPKGSANEDALDKGIQTMLSDGTTGHAVQGLPRPGLRWRPVLGAGLDDQVARPMTTSELVSEEHPASSSAEPATPGRRDGGGRARPGGGRHRPRGAGRAAGCATTTTTAPSRRSSAACWSSASLYPLWPSLRSFAAATRAGGAAARRRAGARPAGGGGRPRRGPDRDGLRRRGDHRGRAAVDGASQQRRHRGDLLPASDAWQQVVPGDDPGLLDQHLGGARRPGAGAGARAAAGDHAHAARDGRARRCG